MSPTAASPSYSIEMVGNRGQLVEFAREPQQIVIVLGIQGSGTSLCAHVLSALGIDMLGPGGVGTQQSPAPDSPTDWERPQIAELHDRVLTLLNRAWSSPLHELAFPPAWWADPRVGEVRRELAAFLTTRVNAGCIGVKDRRAVRLLPMWDQIFNEFKLTPKFVFCLRDPAQIARLLQSSDGLNPMIGEHRWFNYVADFFLHIGQSDFCIIEYEGWHENSSRNLDKLRAFLELPRQQPALDFAIAEIISRDLPQQDAAKVEARQPLVRSMYELARRAAADPAPVSDIRELVGLYIRFQQFQRPLHDAFERQFSELQAARAASAQQEEALAGLQAAVAERDNLMAAARAEADALRGAVAAEQAARQALEPLVSEREAAIAALQNELAAAHAALAATEGARQSTEAALGERDAALAGAQAELGAARTALAQAEGARGDLEASLAEHRAVAAALQSEADALRAALTDAEATQQEGEALLRERDAMLAAAQAELVSLRSETPQTSTQPQPEAAAEQIATGLAEAAPENGYELAAED